MLEFPELDGMEYTVVEAKDLTDEQRESARRQVYLQARDLQEEWDLLGALDLR